MRLEGVHVHPVLPPGSAPATSSRSLALRETTADRFLHDLRWQHRYFIVSMLAASSSAHAGGRAYFFFGRTFDLVSGQQCICACAVPHPLCT